jgi:hypothetical protein
VTRQTEIALHRMFLLTRLAKHDRDIAHIT